MNMPEVSVFVFKLFIMKKLLVLTIYFVSISVFLSCKKDSTAPVQSKGTPEVTEIGSAIEQAQTQTIGSAGGTIESTDGTIELQFPVGALSNNTEISIQPITNNVPGGVGNGYRFGPSGITFNKPVIITFHYTDINIMGTLPQFMGIAFQDTNRVWYSLKSFTYDTINKTIKASTLHFTDYATFQDLVIVPGSDHVKLGESKDFKVRVCEPSDDKLSSLSPNGDEVAPLAKMHDVNDGLVKNWAANGVIGGNSQYGTISPHGAHCTFKAPSAKPTGSKNPVQLSVEVNMKWKDAFTKIDYTKLRLNAPVNIIDNTYEYLLEIIYTDTSWDGAYAKWKISDTASMRVKIENDIATITNYQNQDGVVTPSSQKVTLGYEDCTATWMPENYSGPITVTMATGYAYSDPNVPSSTKTLLFQITTDSRINPLISESCKTSGNFTFGGDDLGKDYYAAEFLLKDSDQVFNDLVTTQLVYKLTSYGKK
jgi:hypothetical protein